MEFNLWSTLVAALSTLVIGFIWYNPKVFGSAWMRESGITYEDAKSSNMGLVLGMSFIYAFFIAATLQTMVIHQIGVLQATGGDLAKVNPSYHAFMADYGTTFRTFKHGMLHGFFAGLFFALPVIGTSALYERRSWKYTLIAGGFWVVSCMIMGGIICAWT